MPTIPNPRSTRVGGVGPVLRHLPYARRGSGLLPALHCEPGFRQYSRRDGDDYKNGCHEEQCCRVCAVEHDNLLCFVAQTVLSLRKCRPRAGFRRWHLPHVRKVLLARPERSAEPLSRGRALGVPPGAPRQNNSAFGPNPMALSVLVFWANGKRGIPAPCIGRAIRPILPRALPGSSPERPVPLCRPMQPIALPAKTPTRLIYAG